MAYTSSCQIYYKEKQIRMKKVYPEECYLKAISVANGYGVLEGRAFDMVSKIIETLEHIAPSESIFTEEVDSSWDEVINLSSPEDVLIEIVGPHDNNPTNKSWKNWTIEQCVVIRGADGIMGAASYEQSYGGFLDYTIQDLIDPPGEGWYVVINITGNFTKGDGWTTDDEMTFYYERVRPALQFEVESI